MALGLAMAFATGVSAAGSGAQGGGVEGERVVVRVDPTGAETAASAGLPGAPPLAAAELEALLPAEATMVVADAAGRRLVRLHPERAARPMPPCSTFKIPNTLIALGAGAISVDDHAMARDPVRDPAGEFWSPAWDADQDLPSALRRSTVWYFQELARRVGAEEMQRQLDRLGYGDRDISAGIDRFWLGESLEISAEQQVDFLRRLHAGDFAFPADHLALLRQGLLQEEGEEHALFAKTGACPIGDGATWVGWWVGWLERPGGTTFFALALTGDGYRQIADRRIPLARSVLAGLGLLPAGG